MIRYKWKRFCQLSCNWRPIIEQPQHNKTVPLNYTLATAINQEQTTFRCEGLLLCCLQSLTKVSLQSLAVFSCETDDPLWELSVLMKHRICSIIVMLLKD